MIPTGRGRPAEGERVRRAVVPPKGVAWRAASGPREVATEAPPAGTAGVGPADPESKAAEGPPVVAPGRRERRDLRPDARPDPPIGGRPMAGSRAVNVAAAATRTVTGVFRDLMAANRALVRVTRVATVPRAGEIPARAEQGGGRRPAREAPRGVTTAATATGNSRGPRGGPTVATVRGPAAGIARTGAPPRATATRRATPGGRSAVVVPAATGRSGPTGAPMTGVHVRAVTTDAPAGTRVTEVGLVRIAVTTARNGGRPSIGVPVGLMATGAALRSVVPTAAGRAAPAGGHIAATPVIAGPGARAVRHVRTPPADPATRIGVAQAVTPNAGTTDVPDASPAQLPRVRRGARWGIGTAGRRGTAKVVRRGRSTSPGSCRPGCSRRRTNRRRRPTST